MLRCTANVPPPSVNAGWNSVFDKLETLTAKLKAPAASQKNFRVLIRADRTLPAVYVQRVLEACANAGISDTVFTALNRD